MKNAIFLNIKCYAPSLTTVKHMHGTLNNPSTDHHIIDQPSSTKNAVIAQKCRGIKPCNSRGCRSENAIAELRMLSLCTARNLRCMSNFSNCCNDASPCLGPWKDAFPQRGGSTATAREPRNQPPPPVRANGGPGGRTLRGPPGNGIDTRN